MPQTSVLDTLPLGVEGQLADFWTEQNGDVVAGTNEEASAELPFGKFVKRGTADGSIKKLTATSNAPFGVVVFSHLYDKPSQIGDVGIKVGITTDVLRLGRILVFPEDAVTPASEVHVRVVVTGSEVVGAVRGTADSTDCIDCTGFCTWESSADAGEPAVLYVNMPLSTLAVAD